VIHEKAPVEQVRRLGGTRHELAAPRGTIRADQVLVATSGYTGRPFRWLQARIAPVGSFIIVTEPLGREVCDQLMPTRRMASDSKSLLYYFRITPDHRLLFGGRAQVRDVQPALGREERSDPPQGDDERVPAADRRVLKHTSGAHAPVCAGSSLRRPRKSTSARPSGVTTGRGCSPESPSVVLMSKVNRQHKE
jgi:glycine/D-amino acid oxidase-like deaminating enzyme